ncbi:MAG: type II toxin-antitoxin system RelE/ParE family toxin [Pseudobdellovibrionaceae bacterium]
MTKPGSKVFTIEYLESVVEEDIPALPKTMRDRIRNAIETRLTADPIGLGKPLRYSFVGHRRIRVGDYRIVYRLDVDHHKVVIVLIKHRKDVYAE